MSGRATQTMFYRTHKNLRRMCNFPRHRGRGIFAVRARARQTHTGVMGARNLQTGE